MKRKEIIWISSSKKDLLSFPEDVIDTMGYALHLTQMGDRFTNTKSLRGFGGDAVIEIIDKHTSGTYRVVYTVEMPKIVFVLHAFQKKSTHGIKTSQQDIDLIKSRFRLAQEIYRELTKNKGS
jgi:phage-related protein